MGFKMNEYNECTFNKMSNCCQCTIKVHVDDLKLSRMHQDELKKIIDQPNDVFGSREELLEVSYEKKYKYLRMTIDWSLEPSYFDHEDVESTIS